MSRCPSRWSERRGKKFRASCSRTRSGCRGSEESMHRRMCPQRFACPGTLVRHLALRGDPVRAVARLVEHGGSERFWRLSCARFKKTTIQASIPKLRARDEDSKKVSAEDTEIAKFFGENERNFQNVLCGFCEFSPTPFCTGFESGNQESTKMEPEANSWLAGFQLKSAQSAAVLSRRVFIASWTKLTRFGPS
jgi:hypothetical protein